MFKTAPTDHLTVRRILADREGRGIHKIALLVDQTRSDLSERRYAETLALGYRPLAVVS